MSGSPLLETGKSNLAVTIALYLIVGVTVGLLCLISFVGVCEVNMSSMEATLSQNDHVLTQKYPTSIKVGDIVIVDAPDSVQPANEDKHILFIKRVVALGGDDLLFELSPDDPARVVLSRQAKGNQGFTEIKEDFVRAAFPRVALDDMLYSSVAFPKDFYPSTFDEDGRFLIHIPEKHIFVLGDNRNNSNDSRKYGPFALTAIQGKAFYKLKPNTLINAFFRFLYKSSSQQNRFFHISAF
ncbi:MAG: signal peptidase I [Firmicutes bacterium]|nr:signal peptidase I [Bacillota bacterium]